MVKKKILHIIPEFATGGAEKLVLHYADFLDRDKFEMAVASSVEDGSLRPLFDKQKTKLFVGSRKTMGGRLGAARQLSLFVSGYAPDIIHTHLFGADLFGWYFKTKFKNKIIWISTQHNVEYRTSFLRKFIWQIILKRADRIICVADKVKAYGKKEFSLPEAKMEVIRNGIDTEKWLEVKTLVGRQKTLELAIVGRLEEQKGHKYLLLALSQLKDRDWNLHVYGEGSLKTFLHKLAMDLQIDKRIVWHGIVNDLSEKYKKIDIVCQPSLWEGLSLVVMEAMSAARVVVASVAAGEELIKDNETGFLFPIGSVQGIIDVLVYCFENKNQLNEVAVRARSYAVDNFNIKENVFRIEEIYNRLLL